MIAGAAGAVVATNAWEARADRRAGVSPLERAQRTWLRNKAFMEELGLDPIEVLGRPPRQPAAPAAAPAPVAVAVEGDVPLPAPAAALG